MSLLALNLPGDRPLTADELADVVTLLDALAARLSAERTDTAFFIGGILCGLVGAIGMDVRTSPGRSPNLRSLFGHLSGWAARQPLPDGSGLTIGDVVNRLSN